MSLPKSRVAFTDCYEVLDQTLAEAKGIRIRFRTHDAAIHFRMRLHQARKLDRDANAETYEKGHSMHGTSAYDQIVARDPVPENGGAWLYLEKIDLANQVEAIEPLNDFLVIEHRAPLQLEGPKVEIIPPTRRIVRRVV